MLELIIGVATIRGSLQREGLHSGWLRSQGNPDQFAVAFFLCFAFSGTNNLGGYIVGAYNVRGYILKAKAWHGCGMNWFR